MDLWGRVGPESAKLILLHTYSINAQHCSVFSQCITQWTSWCISHFSSVKSQYKDSKIMHDSNVCGIVDKAKSDYYWLGLNEIYPLILRI